MPVSIRRSRLLLTTPLGCRASGSVHVTGNFSAGDIIHHSGVLRGSAGNAAFTWLGNGTTTANAGSGACVATFDAATIEVNGVACVDTSGQGCFSANSYSHIFFIGTESTCNTTGVALTAGTATIEFVNVGIGISSTTNSAVAAFLAGSNGVITWDTAQTIDINSNITFSLNTVYLQEGSFLSLGGGSFNLHGNTVTGTSFACGINSIMFAGANPNATIPGTVNGTVGPDCNSNATPTVQPAVYGGTGATSLPIGAVKANGTQVTGQAACGDLSNAGSLCPLTPGTGVAAALGNNTNASGGVPTVPVANSDLANSSTIVAGQTCALGSTCGLSTASNTLSSDVSLSNASNYFDGPSMVQGSTGTWWVSGNVQLDSSTSDTFRCKLWDGTTVIASAQFYNLAGDGGVNQSLSGLLASPAGNIRISCRDVSTANGAIRANSSANSHDSTIWGIRIN